jgi:hypothetical protein
MRFEERELKPYAEPISAGELKEGSVYFSVNYVDEAMLIPVVEPVVFIGSNLDADDHGRVYFQDIESYRAGVRHDTASADDQATFLTGSDKRIGHIFEYESALDELLRCALRRREHTKSC